MYIRIQVIFIDGSQQQLKNTVPIRNILIIGHDGSSKVDHPVSMPHLCRPLIVRDCLVVVLADPESIIVAVAQPIEAASVVPLGPLRVAADCRGPADLDPQPLLVEEA